VQTIRIDHRGSAIHDENRRWPRRAPVPGEPLRRARARMGHDLDVIDISDAGALVEGRARLLPNTKLDAHFVLRTGRVLVRCRVVRACVCHVEADLVRYRVGLAFDHPVDTSGGYPVPAGISRDFQAVGSTYPDPTFHPAAVVSDAASG
jgi:hypothetical protein